MTQEESSSSSSEGEGELMSDAEAAPGVFDMRLEGNWGKVQELLGREPGPYREVERRAQSKTSELVVSATGAPGWEEGAGLVVGARMERSWTAANGAPGMSAAQEAVGRALAAQMDAFYLCQGEEDEGPLRALYCLHALQMALGARARRARSARAVAEARAAAVAAHRPLRMVDEGALGERDRGFTRAQTLLLAPMRNTAHDAVCRLRALWCGLGAGRQVEQWARFEEEFGAGDEQDRDQAQNQDTDTDQARRKDTRPPAFKHLFRGNTDDCFRLGIKFTRRAMRLFVDLHDADVIVASPLGLVLLQGSSASPALDCLSSVELLVVEQADVLGMQNWEHAARVLQLLNGIPQQARGCDFARVRSAFLDGQARRVRQSLVLSRRAFPELNAALHAHMANCRGAARWDARGAPLAALQVLARHCAHVRAVPALLPVPGGARPADAPAARLEHFCRRLLAPLLRALATGAVPGGVCVFVASSFDFCQVRAHLAKAAPGVPVACLGEDASNADVTRARSRFFNGLAKLLLLSERFYFYRRYRLRGIRRLYFYSLPECPEFFAELVGMLGDAAGAGDADAAAPARVRVHHDELLVEPHEVPCLVSPLDHLKAERIFGTARARALLE